MIGDTDDGVITEEELIANLWSIYVGGHDTSALSICNAMVTLLRHPDQLNALQADLTRLPNAVEEILRHIGTVHGTHRLMSEDIELGGHHIPADTPVMVYLSAANHDEGWCPHAEKFDIDRDVPSDHLAFGTGPHVCPGAALARMEGTLAVEELLERVARMETVPDAVYPPLPGSLGHHPIPARLVPVDHGRPGDRDRLTDPSHVGDPS